MKRIWSLLVSIGLLLGLMPTVALAADGGNLWVGGLEVTAGGEADVFGDGTVSFDPLTNTLTLQDCTYTGAGYENAAIYYGGDKKLTVEVLGTNTFTADTPEADYSYGIYAKGDLVITGGGSLTVTGGDATLRSFGILAEGSLEVSNSTLTAIGGGERDSFGAMVTRGHFASSAATFTASAVERESIGLYIVEELTLHGGFVHATGNESGNGSVGIYATGDLWVNEGRMTGIGNRSKFYSYGVAISATGTLTQGSGAVIATGGPVTKDDGSSYGVLGKMETTGFTAVIRGESRAFRDTPTVTAWDGWAPLVWQGDKSSEVGDPVQPDATDFTAKYVKISDKATYTVTFDRGFGGGGEMAAVSEVDVRYTLPECAFTPPVGERFVAWELDGVRYQPGKSIPVYTDITLVALWEEEEVEETGLLGDVDEDGSITSTDARLTLQFYAGKIGEEDLNIALADVDGDGTITSTDARLILQKYAGKIEDFPI